MFSSTTLALGKLQSWNATPSTHRPHFPLFEQTNLQLHWPGTLFQTNGAFQVEGEDSDVTTGAIEVKSKKMRKETTKSSSKGGRKKKIPASERTGPVGAIPSPYSLHFQVTNMHQ